MEEVKSNSKEINNNLDQKLNETDVSVLEKGMNLIKMHSESADKHRFYILNTHDNKIVATTKEFMKKEKIYLLSSINEIKRGCSTDTVKLFDKNASNDKIENIIKCSFTIAFDHYKKSISLIAPSQTDRDRWVSVIDFLIKSRIKTSKTSSHQPNTAELFASADKGKDQMISHQEAMNYLSSMNIKLKKSEIKNLLKISDTDNDGRFNFKEFDDLIKKLYFRKEIPSLFKLICCLEDTAKSNVRRDSSARRESKSASPEMKVLPEFVSWHKFQLFLELYQRETKNEYECKDIIRKYEPTIEDQLKTSADSNDLKLSLNGLSLYLNDQFIVNSKHESIYQDMDKTFSSYFINSSHNTYLTGDQLTSISSADGYIMAIMKGARLLEMDCYDGSDGQPKIYHHGTLTSKITFEEALIAIRDYAFKLTSYPLIITIELHCGPEQRKTMAALIKKNLKDFIYCGFNGQNYPTLGELKNKIILRCRRPPVDETEDLGNKRMKNQKSEDSGNSSTPDINKSVTESEKQLDSINELDEFINILQNASFKGVDHAFKNFSQINTSSISEPKIKKFLESETPFNMIKYTANYLAKIYPAYYRTGSSNFDPMHYWIYGFQMAALNFQTRDLPMQLNDALFSDNGGCGFVLKPNILTDPTLGFNPLDTKTMKNKKILEIKVISGQSLPMAEELVKDITDPYVKVSVHGVPSDCCEAKTKSIKDNGLNPLWNQDFRFTINCPELALIKFSVRDEDFGKNPEIGYFTIRFESIKPGYRYIKLINKKSKGSLFVGIKIDSV